MRIKATAAILIFFLVPTIFCAPVKGEKAPKRALFVSVIDDPPVLESRSAIKGLLSFARAYGVGALYVQIYRENKAWFPSDSADGEPYERAVSNVGEDPFALLIREAKAAGIEVHAWMNLMSLGANAEAPLLARFGPSILTTNGKPKASLDDYRIDGQFFVEPGDLRVRAEILSLVEEAVRAYPDMDGLILDYIRYPDWKPWYGRTAENERRFMEATGTPEVRDGDPAWKAWLSAQVTDTVRAVRGRAKALNPRLQVSTTGLVPYSRATLEAFQDWRAWLDEGLADFVTLMVYSKDAAFVERCLADAARRLGGLSRVNVATGAYWPEHPASEFRKQMDLCAASEPRACVIFHYGGLAERPELASVYAKTRGKERSDAQSWKRGS